MPMYGELDALLDAAIEDAPRQRKAETASLLRAMADAIENQQKRRADFRAGYAKAVKHANSDERFHEQRSALRALEGDYDAEDDQDLITGAWLRRVSNLPQALEPTIDAVIKCVVHCHSLADALKDFEAAAGKDKKVHADKGRQLIRDYPYFGGRAHEDVSQFDFNDLGRKREARDRTAR